MQRAAIFKNTYELQPSVSFVNRYGLQPERSLCKKFCVKNHAPGLTQSISVLFVFTYCAIIANQSYTKDFLNSAFKARHSNFQMFDKVNDDLYKRCLLLYFMLKKQELDQSQQEDKVYRFRTDFLNV